MTAEPRFLIGTSLKTYFTHARTLEWAREFAAICRAHPAVAEGTVAPFVIPTFPALTRVVELVSPYSVGAQDVSEYPAGAYTGEVTAEELAEVGCRLVEIGHAERRRLFGETDPVVRAKVARAASAGLTPLLCVGEADRIAPEDAAAECLRQVRDATADAAAPVVVAYEPHWAIGAPAPAPDEHIVGTCRALRAALSADPALAGSRVIYGGSAGPGLLSRIAGDVDGLFLGRFAHDPAAFAAVLDEASRAA